MTKFAPVKLTKRSRSIGYGFSSEPRRMSADDVQLTGLTPRMLAKQYREDRARLREYDTSYIVTVGGRPVDPWDFRYLLLPLGEDPEVTEATVHVAVEDES